MQVPCSTANVADGRCSVADENTDRSTYTCTP